MQEISEMKAIIPFLLFLGSALIVINFPLYPVFSFEETRTTDPNNVYIQRQKSTELFQIVYKHSIHLSDVIETYKVAANDQIQLISMEYEDVAIGMPGFAEEGETLIYADGQYTLSYEARYLPSFTMHISNISSEQHFSYNDELFDLKVYLQRGSSYLFEIKKISLLQRWKGDLLKNDK